MCGVAGAFNVPNAAVVLRSILHTEQNRGREACGILTIDNEGAKHHKRFLGTVSDKFTGKVIKKLIGSQGIGHVRYGTVRGEESIKNVHPVELRHRGKPLAIAHNGTLTNMESLEASLADGLFKTDIDSELILHLIARSPHSSCLGERVASILPQLRGSCSAVVTTPSELVAFCDQSGNRPLHYAPYGDGYLIASETAALTPLDIPLDSIEDIQPGEVVSFSNHGIRKIQTGMRRLRRCVFERVYFAFPHSRIFGANVDQFRVALGEGLAEEKPVDADVVIGIPDSAKLMAEGYARRSGVPLQQSLIERRHNTGRTFILPGQTKREKAVSEKFALSPDLRDKRVILIDDSIVRSTTSQNLTTALFKQGVAEVHWRIASPPIIGPCFYGINTPHRESLIAAKQDSNIAAIREEIGATSLAYLSLERLKEVNERYALPADETCFSCMDGQYWDK